MKPYTYLIGWSEKNIWYYGVRYAENCHPSDLWVSYFTSSKIVKLLRKEIGEPNIIKIRKIFDDSKKAIIWESKVLKRLNASKREDFLNLQNGSGDIAYKHDDLMRKIKSEKMKKYWTNDKKRNKSKNMKEYNKINGTERYSFGLRKRYEDKEFMHNFKNKMNEVNKDIDKRNKAGNSIKKKWQNEEYRNKTIKNRLGIVWWNNGIDTIKSKNCPGDEWTRGRANNNLGRKKNETNKN